MNNNDKIDFNGKKITIEDLLEKPEKVILVGLFVQTQGLDIKYGLISEKVKGIDEKIDNQWAKISHIKYIKGILYVLVPIVLYLLYNLKVLLR